LSLFTGRSAWIFDVDYTLYGPEAALFEQVVPRITQFVADHMGLPLDQAREVQRDYYLRYGSTMAGMARHQGVDPHVFSGFVHDIDYSVLAPAPELRAQIAALPGRKFLFTNATLAHATRVLEGLGMALSDFDGAFDVEMADWTPKPAPLPYERLMAKFAIAPEQAVFFEDTAGNLETARQLGWGTVWIKASEDPRQKDQQFEADLTGPSLSPLLRTILESP